MRRARPGLALIGEIGAGYVLRDNLAPDVAILRFPIEALADRQAAGGVK